MGTYTLKYNVFDNEGQGADEVARTVSVVDTTSPIISFTGGAAAMAHEAGDPWVEPGVVVTDTVDANPTLQIAGNVDVTTPGVYILTYNATDANGNAAVEKLRTVTVVDTTVPVITLRGSSYVTITNLEAWSDPWVDVTDNSSVQPVVTSVTNSSTPPDPNVSPYGPVIYTYTATDADGNSASVQRTLQYVDHNDPVILLNGPNTVTHEAGTAWLDPVSATDANGGTLIVATQYTKGGESTDEISASSPIGSYILIYSATDSAGKSATSMRTVHVVDSVAPLLNLVGTANVTIVAGTPWTDPGVIVVDNVDSAPTWTTTGTVDTTTPGNYTIHYMATDASENTSTATRTVNVVDTWLIPGDITSYLRALAGEMGRVASQFQMAHHLSRHRNVWIERRGRPRFYEPRVENVENVVLAPLPPTLPGAPERIEVAYHSGQLQWAWRTPTGSTGITGYRIEVSTSGPALNFVNPIVNEILPNQPTYSHNISIATTTTFYVRIWATNGAGSGPFAGLGFPVAA